jgi:hypothetical protein
MHCSGICLKTLRRTTNFSMAVGVPTEIRTVHVPNKILDHASTPNKRKWHEEREN